MYKHTLIAGAGHGIGLALVKACLRDFPGSTLHATYNRSEKAKKLFELQKQHPDTLHLYQLDAVQEKDYKELALKFKKSDVNLGLFINCIGYLHDSENAPEKSIYDIDVAYLSKSFAVNSIPAVLFAKHLFPFLRKGSVTVVGLSARLGSIEDNQNLGGWYGYRASKAALNMFLRNFALELKRVNKQSTVLAIHPGTTKTELSKPFIVNTKYQLHDPEETANNILKVVAAKTPEESGTFWDWRDNPIAW